MMEINLSFLVFYSLLGISCSIPSVNLLPSLCGTTADRSVGSIIKAHEGVGNGVSVFADSVPSCIYVIQAASPSQRLRFGFGTGHGEVNFISESLSCFMNQVTLRDSDGTTILAGPLCGVLSRTSYISSGDRLTLSVSAFGGNNTILNFTAHYTSFTSGANCTSDLFPCTNGRCVAPQSRCDPTLIDDCGDFSDNSPGPPGNCSDPTTTIQPTTTVTTQNTTTAAPSPQGDLVWIAYIAGGLFGAYFLYWLLWRPGYLVWRCGGWRHLPCCRNHGLCQHAGGQTSPSRWGSCCGESKIASSGPAANDAINPPITSSGGNVADFQTTATNGLSTIPEQGEVAGAALAATGAGATMGGVGGATGAGATMGGVGGAAVSSVVETSTSTSPPRVSQIEREPHIFTGRKSSSSPPFIVLA